jgi:hypothetical protein
MTTTVAFPTETAPCLDFGMLRRVFITLGLGLLLMSPMAPDPIAFAVGGMVPAVLIQIVSTPTMPAGILYFLFWQWLQIFARVFQGVFDGMPMSRSIYGQSVEDAYWYMMASVVVLAVAVRIVLGNVPAPTERNRIAHLNWRPADVFAVYIGSFVLSLITSQIVRFVPSLYQQFDALGKLKTAVLLVLFTVVLGLNKGYQFLFAALGIELVMGFTGLLSEFRGVFIVLAISAVAARVKWTTITSIAAVGWLVALLGLALFWTAVKTDYRAVATEASLRMEEETTQEITASFEDRIGFILDRVLSPDEIDWADAAYSLVQRLAYVDIFGSVVSVRDTLRDDPTLEQWSDALSHVFQPRFLFPNKASIVDSDVYLKLTKADPTEYRRINTSISVGYMGENYYDLQFPAMLAGIFAVGFVVALVARYFMHLKLPWMVREALVMGFVFTAAGTGVEAALPKIIGSTVMFFVVYALLARFAFPTGLRWLDSRSIQAREVEARMKNVQQQQNWRRPQP